jgi:hypothetical protein
MGGEVGEDEEPDEADAGDEKEEELDEFEGPGHSCPLYLPAGKKNASMLPPLRPSASAVPVYPNRAFILSGCE